MIGKIRRHDLTFVSACGYTSNSRQLSSREGTPSPHIASNTLHMQLGSIVYVGVFGRKFHVAQTSFPDLTLPSVRFITKFKRFTSANKFLSE